MNVSLYTFAKKKNSTATPTSVPTVYDCTLKDGCSLVNPTIGLDIGLLTSPASFNYAQIDTFLRFYYVKDWYWDKGLWWANLTVDVLATYKTGILNSTLYIARASKEYDGTIADNLFPAKTSLSDSWISEWNTQQALKSPWVNSFANGFYVAGIINNDSDSIGAVSYYAFTPSQFATLKSFLLGDTTWTGIMTTNPDIGENLYKSLFNPFQYISSINWFPFSFNTSWGQSISSLKFGWWVINNLFCYRLTSYQTTITQAMLIGSHPQSDERGRYLNGPPYSLYRMIAPPFGEFELDGSLLYDALYVQYDATKCTSVSVEITVDFIAGSGVLHVSANNNGEFFTLLLAQTNIAVPIQIAQITTDKWGEIRNTAETGAKILSSASSLNVGGVVANITTGIFNAIESRIPHMQQQGNNGSLAIYNQDFRIECIYYTMADDALNDKGRPLCKEVQTSTLYPGYVLAVGAHVSVAGTEEEIASINAELDRGVYLE